MYLWYRRNLYRYILYIYIDTHTYTYDSIEVEEGRKYIEIEGAERFSPSVPTFIVYEELYIGYIYGTHNMVCEYLLYITSAPCMLREYTYDLF